MKKKHPVVHFEMPYDDRERLAKFYSTVFGWEMNKLGENMGNYVLATTTETDDKRMIKTPGNINGGFFPKNAGYPQNCPSLVIAVDDIKEMMQQINAAGGKVLGEPIEIPNIGWYVFFVDTEGNYVSILQPKKR